MDAASQIKLVGTDRENDRELYVLELATPDDLPMRFDVASDFFAALIVWDATDVSLDTISRFARRLLDAGGVYFCAWGRDCGRVHDIIDEEFIGDGLDTLNYDDHIMTTWHENESLADVIWFVLFSAFPIERYLDGCRSVIAICIDCPKLAAEIRDAFVDPCGFSAGYDAEDQRGITTG